MGLTLSTANTQEPVTIVEARDHLRITWDHEDAALAQLILSARVWAEDFTHRAFMNQTFVMTLDAFAETILLPKGKCQSISSISYIDSDGNTQNLTGPTSSPAGTDWLEDLSHDEHGRITPPYNNTWPSARSQVAAVSVTFIAGYGDDADDVPAPLKSAILFRVADLYETRSEMDGKWTGVARSILEPYVVRML